MGLFERILGKNEKSVLQTPFSPPAELFNTSEYRNLREFKHAVLQDWSGEPAKSLRNCDCGYYKKFHTPCSHIYMKALKDGVFKDVFTKGAQDLPGLARLSDGAFSAFSNELYYGHYEEGHRLGAVERHASELEAAGLITVRDDVFYYSDAVNSNILYVLYTAMSDMRCPIKAQSVKAKARWNERRKIEEQIRKRAESKKESRKAGQFSIDYADKCEKMEERIDDMEMPDVDDPEKKIAFFQKKMAKVDEMEAFCADVPGGQEYFDRHYPLLRQRIQWDLDDYMEDEYESDRERLEQIKVEQKLVNGMKSRIKKEIKKAGSIKATDLKKLFPEEEQRFCAKALRELEKSGAVVKEKDGGRIVYGLK